MSKTRNLKYQLLNCIEKNFKESINKHSLKQSGKQGNEIFSYSQRKNLIDLSANFSNWMKQTHNEIKQVKDITPQHVQEFLNSKTDCSQATLKQYQSQFRKLENLVNDTYKTNIDYHSTTTPISKKNGGGKLRIDMLSVENYNKMLNTTNVNLRNALILSQNFGLRCEEISRLKGSDISEQGIKIVGSKGGRDRLIPIETTKQMQIAKEFMQKVGRICPIQKGSLQQAFNREKKRQGIASASDFHSCRKAYATEKFKEYRASGLSVQQSLNRVSNNLGHGSNRNDLMKEYICCSIE